MGALEGADQGEVVPMMLAGEGVIHRFGGLPAVNDVSFHVEQGEIVGLIGPNGAGKTTLFNLISGAIKLREGAITLKGKDISRLGPDRICRMGMARTFQTTKLFDGMTAFENVALALLYGSPHRKLRLDQARREVNTSMASMGLLADRHKPVSDLPLAARRRLEVTRALATGADMLLLDEAMAGLTQAELTTSMEMIARLRERGTTILMIEHVMQAIMGVCDRIMVLHEGRKIADARPDQIASDPTVRAIYLGD